MYSLEVEKYHPQQVLVWNEAYQYFCEIAGRMVSLVA